MIRSSDGTTTKRVGGNIGDRAPAVGFQRHRALYTATGGETSLDLSLLNPSITYSPGQSQISIERSSGGSSISGVDFFEISANSISFPLSRPLLANEVIEVTKEFSVTGVMAVNARPDIHTEVATQNQILVNARFSWPLNLNPTQAQGAVRVYIHGVKQARGVDYTEVDLGSGNTNQIQFTDPMNGGENITLEPTYQVLDQSAATSTFLAQQNQQMQAMLSSSTQAFVDQTAYISVPFSSIVNRAKIIDISKDLRVVPPCERFMSMDKFISYAESGPNGEQVHRIINDDRDLIRLVGGSWTAIHGLNGSLVQTNSINDYAEITFYGTALNFLTLASANRDIRVTIDSGTESVNLIPASNNFAQEARNFGTNTIISAASGLSLDFHTAKIRFVSGPNLTIYGIEILNPSNNITVNSGTAYNFGQRYQALTASQFAINAAATGTKGGRVTTYILPNGTRGQAFTPVDATQKNFAAADHSNEEVSKRFNWRSYGAGRNDDFSIGGGYDVVNLSTKYFVQDDNSNALLSNNAFMFLNNLTESVGVDAVGDYLTISFIGTGLDAISARGVAPTNSYNVFVDGAQTASSVSAATLFGNGNNNVAKIVSGLAYGSHTIKIAMASPGIVSAFSSFIVYQPKKPTIPALAVELSDYNLLGNFVPNSIAANEAISQGVLRKSTQREVNLVGTWSSSTADTAYIDGFQRFTTTSGDYLEYVFYGTGIELRGRANTAWSGTNTISLQALAGAGSLQTLSSTNFPSLSALSYGGYSFNYTTGNLSIAAGSAYGSGASINGLPVGLYKVRITNGTSLTMSFDTIDVITPIHTAQSNGINRSQSAILVGNCTVSDTRRTSLIKDQHLQRKNVSQAFGISNGPTNGSTYPIPLNDLTTVHYNTSGRIMINYNYTGTQSGGQRTNCQIYVDSNPIGFPKCSYVQGTIIFSFGDISDSLVLEVTPGEHKVDVYWWVTAGFASADGYGRNLTVIEL